MAVEKFSASLLARKLRDDGGGTVSDGFWYAPVDLFSLVLIVVAGIELGLIGLFGFSLLAWLFGSWRPFVYDAIGASAVWQIARQRFFG